MQKFGISLSDVAWVVITHVHVDHLLGIYSIQEYCERIGVTPPEFIALGESARVIREADIEAIFPGELDISPQEFGVEIKPLPASEVQDGDELDFGDFKFRVIECPGHAEGSMCLIENNYKILISGDVIFSGGAFGRVDFPGGSGSKLISSIERLIHEDFEILLPGHMSHLSGGPRNAQMSLQIARQML